MTRLEDDLRDSYRRNAPTPDQLPMLDWAPTTGGHHIRPGWLLPVLAAASVALVILGAGVVARGTLGLNSPSTRTPATGPLPNESGDPEATIGGQSPGSTPRVVVHGTRTESYRHVAVTVSIDLAVTTWYQCRRQDGPTLIVGPPPTGCAQPVHGLADVPLVRLTPSESAVGRELIADATHHVMIHGVEAFTSCRQCSSYDIANGTHSTNEVGILYFPEQKVVIDAHTGNADAGPDTIFRTARVL